MIYVQQLVASNFAKNRKNIKKELCLNVFFSFSHCPLFLLLCDVTKAVFLVNQNGGTSGHQGVMPPPTTPPLATALVGSIHFVFNFYIQIH